jgi:phytoene dehydrogenase-like protein
MSAAKYDVIVVGAGHNGLVTAAYLAKAGRKVLVLERADVPGGQLAARRLWPEVEAPALHPSGQLRPDIVRDLDLERHGLRTAAAPGSAAYVSLLPDGGSLRLTTDAGDTASRSASSRRETPRAGRSSSRS